MNFDDSDLDAVPPDGRALTHEATAIVSTLTGAPANAFRCEYVYGQLGRACGVRVPERTEIMQRLGEPLNCLKAIYRYYAFARRGKERNALGEASLAALERAVEQHGPDKLLNRRDARPIWDAFLEECPRFEVKPNPDLNLGVVAGLAELTFEVHQRHNASLQQWVAQAVEQEHRIEAQFQRVVDVRGVGPKIASTILRDFIEVGKVEHLLARRDSIYVQPIDRWVRAIAPMLLRDPRASQYSDWILAGKISMVARQTGHSPIALSYGIAEIGMRSIGWHEPEAQFRRIIAGLLSESGQTQS